jgi:hypothetical protein
MSSPTRNTTYTVTVSAYRLVKTQPYALIISGNIGHYPYTPPKRDYTLYIIAGILMMILLGGCILGCVCVMHRRARDRKNKKVGARMEDDEDEEKTDKEDPSERRKQHPEGGTRAKGGKTPPGKKVHPENIQVGVVA